MYQFTVSKNGEDTICYTPMGWQDVKLHKLDMFIRFAKKNAPSENLSIEQVRRPGVIGWITDQIRGKSRDIVGSIELVEAWHKYRIQEITFWTETSTTLIECLSDADIIAIHTWICSCLVSPPVGIDFDGFEFRGQKFKVEVPVNDSLEKISDMTNLVSLACKSETGVSYEKSYFDSLPADIAFQVAYKVTEMIGGAANFAAYIIAQWCMGKGSELEGQDKVIRFHGK